MIDFYSKKDLSKFIGVGVAMKDACGHVRKHKILGLKVHYDCSGFYVQGVELDMPPNSCTFYERKTYEERGLGFQEGTVFYFKPEFLFRNKGECMRFWVDGHLNSLKSKLDDSEKPLSQKMDEFCKLHEEWHKLQEETNSIRRQLDTYAEYRDSLKVYGKKRKKHRKGEKAVDVED